MKIFDFIKGKNFFTYYAKEVTNWRYKMSGKDGHGKPIEFSDQDKKEMIASVNKLAKDLIKLITDI